MRAWWFATRWSALALLAASTPAGAADFRARAAGHVYTCGGRTISFDKDGGASLSMPDDTDIMQAAKVRWSPHGVEADFGPSAGRLALSEYGATVTAKTAAGSAVCVSVR